MRLHNEGRREVATLRSMCCVRILSAFLPTGPDVVFLSVYVCVMNETGAFFSGPAFLFGERINTALYKMVAGDLRFHSLSQHLSL